MLQARAAGLAIRPQWLRLGHYRPRLGGGWASEVDGPAFFLSGSGKADPEAELVATLRGLFHSAEAPANDDHPLCAFPARAAWLSRELSIDPGALPQVRCGKRDEFLAKVDPHSTTLIFSSYYLNNPVSAFGHTFLRINSAASGVSTTKRELLDYGIDYAAVSGPENAVLYAFKGLFGMFPGLFNAMPYYYKVRKYNDMESRDIWQYDLTLTPEETRFLVQHLWELGRTHIDYWYLTENCSYHILGALEAARPSLDLTSGLTIPVLPANTVKAVVAAPDLVAGIRYRPSIRSQFRARIRGFQEEQLSWVVALADDPSFPLPDGVSAGEAAELLDAATDLVEVRHFRELVAEPGGAAARLKQGILARRAGLGVASPELALPAKEAEMPHLGHDSRRAGIGLGYSSDRGAFAEGSVRLALHDLVDPSAGYPDTSQIEFFPLRLRYFPRGDRVRLEDGDLVRVLSLSPWDRFQRDLSWKIGVGATTIHDSGCPGGCTAARAGGGVGVAWALPSRAVMAFGTLDGDVLATPALEGGIGEGPVRAGGGPSMGLRLRPHRSVAAVLSGKWSLLPGQDPGGVWQAEGSARWGVGKALAVGMHATAFPEDLSFGLSIYGYF
ncbi:MAG: Lnb N-terminal periplasmic domain-containing protein [Deferrisomatales bacterium]